jgi:potassium efflux system protein
MILPNSSFVCRFLTFLPAVALCLSVGCVANAAFGQTTDGLSGNSTVRPSAPLSDLPSNQQSVPGQIDPNGLDQVPVSVEQIDDATVEIESDASLTADQKDLLNQRLQRGKQALLNAAKLPEQADSFAKMNVDVPSQIKELKSQIGQAESQPIVSYADLSVDELTAQVAEFGDLLSKATSQAQQLSVEPARRQTRLNEIAKQLIETDQEIETIQAQLKRAAAPNESVLEAKVRTMWLAARAKELVLTKELLTKERNAYLRTSELLPVQQQAATQAVSSYRATLATLNEQLVQRKRSVAADTIRKAENLVKQVPKPLTELAIENVQLAKKQSRLIADVGQVAANLSEIETAKDEVAKESATSKSRVSAVGLTDALGVMFRERRETFEKLAVRFQPNLSVRQKIAGHQIESFQIEDAIRRVDLELEQFDAPKIDWESDEIDWQSLSTSDAEWTLLKKHRKLLAETLEAQKSLLQSVLDGDTSRRDLAKEIRDYNAFVNQRLFWTRSAPLLSVDELKQFPSALSWLVQPINWSASLRAIGRSFSNLPLQSLLVTMLGISILVGRSRLRRFTIVQGGLANRYSSTFAPTLRALLASIVAAAAWPTFLAAISFLLLKGAEDRFAHVLGNALLVVSIFIASRELLREICRDGGLADAHLGWPKQLRRYLRIHLRWYTVLGAGCVFLMVMLESHPDMTFRTHGTRLPATMLFVVIAAFHHVVFRKRSPLYAAVVSAHSKSAIYRRQKLLWSIAVFLPLSFSVLALAGYLDTVLRLGWLVQITLLWLLAVLLVLSLVYRWISLQRRDVSRRQATEARRKRLEALATDSSEIALPKADANEESEIADLPTLDQKTRETAWVLAVVIAIVGLGFIWHDILPAIEYFDEWTLWSVGNGDSLEVVSLLDLLLAATVVLGLVFAARNFISLLELMILSRMSLDSGARYALSMLLQYVLFIVGSIAVFKLLSIPVQQLGWLLAAVSVGIGFGLQEIIANFVCGIILLLERPVRVGDVVTIDNTTGTVSKIQMRATTVTNWDRKELVIPNKDLITGKVLNWSLSSVVNRLTLTVGVQYGTDPDVVREILLGVVAQHPEILKDPGPAINLESFGDSSLNFVVRFYLPNLNSRIAVTHEVNTAIARAFAKENIEIPFPQRDVRLSVVSDQVPIPIATDR